MISGVRLLEPLSLGPATAPNRVMFGPIVTNLANDERRFSGRHVTFYRTRAAGGCGIIVTEEAGVHPSDWPYERAPLAARCGDGWREIAAACRQHGSLVIAALGHAGGQGSSAFSQAPLWAPSHVAEVNTREVPKSMEDDDIRAVIAGFIDAARTAVTAGCDGVEINVGQHSLVRQFLSGLTNQRSDAWGSDRLKFARDILNGVRSAIGPDRILGLRLSCDEMAPWAGITPEMAVDIAATLTEPCDYLAVVRGSIYTVEKTRPDFHEPAGFNIDLCRSIKNAVGASVAVVLQGSVVDPSQAEWALGDGVCDAVEFTRAQLADPEFVGKLASGRPERIRPCIRCNQTCQVRDARNPIITCVVEPSTGHESSDPQWYRPTTHQHDVVVVGGGVAGMEAARVAAANGHRVGLLEATGRLGGVTATIPHAKPFTDWLITEITRLGVEVHLHHRFGPGHAAGLAAPTGRRAIVDAIADAVEAEADAVNADAVNADADVRNDGADYASATASGAANSVVIQCTGSITGIRSYVGDDEAVVLDIADVRSGAAVLPTDGPIVLFDPIGGPIAVAIAEELGGRAVLLTQDQIAGNELSRTGDLAPANARLQQAGVQIERRTLLRRVTKDHVTVEDRFTGLQRDIACAAVIDCGFRLPSPPLVNAAVSAGDCVAPRTILEAVLEARRAVQALDTLDIRESAKLMAHAPWE